MYFKTVNVNHGWMSTVDEKTGYGNIKREDFVRLLENHGFRVDEAKDLTLEYKFSKKFSEGFIQNTILTAFPEIVGVEREEFFKEFISRADQLKNFVSFSTLRLGNSQFLNIMIFFLQDSDVTPVGGIQIIGEKISEI